MTSKNGLQKHTLFLREGDMEFLKEILPTGQASHAVRTVVSNFVDKIRNMPLEEQSVTPTDIDNL